MKSDTGLGFIKLSKEEIEIILGFNKYNELYFPEFIKSHTGLEALNILESLIYKGLVVKSKPFTLTKAGKRHKEKIKTSLNKNPNLDE